MNHYERDRLYSRALHQIQSRQISEFKRVLRLIVYKSKDFDEMKEYSKIVNVPYLNTLEACITAYKKVAMDLLNGTKVSQIFVRVEHR